MQRTLTHLSLFSGIGGLDLAAEAAGFTTVGQCEWADYPTKVLEKHWPDVPRWRDIRTLTGDDFYAKTGLRAVDIVSGGFPCQPFSLAGQRRGKADDRYLWPEMLRIISELRPAWVLGENVPGIVNLALDTVLSDLEGTGYACQTFIVPAAGVDAPHKRDRIAIIAYSDRYARNKRRPEPERQQRQTRPTNGRDAMADADSAKWWPQRDARYRLEELEDSIQQQRKKGADRFECGSQIFSDTVREHGQGALHSRRGWAEPPDSDWWPTEPNVGRVAHGVPSRVDRLRCLGNAVVPAQFYPFFKFIAEIEGT